MSTTTKIVVAGHAYRPPKSQFGRKPIPGCECGKELLGWSVTNETARYIHREHKRTVAREAR